MVGPVANADERGQYSTAGSGVPGFRGSGVRRCRVPEVLEVLQRVPGFRGAAFDATERGAR